MRLSQTYVPTLREDPAEAELVSHKHMLRSGMIRKVASGIYSYLPLGISVLRKVEQIVREEMVRSGAREVLLPALLPAELWEETGRWNMYGKELLRIKDRNGRDFCYGPTHEEAITSLVRNEVRSYKQLPLNLFQIQTKFRDEIRPRFGVMRAREFLMKDAYSFDKNKKDALVAYENMKAAYFRIFERCGLEFRAVDADTGMIGGSSSHEFMVVANSGEEEIVSCTDCAYSANMEKAGCRISAPDNEKDEQELSIEKVATEDKKSIADVADFLSVPLTRVVKTLVYQTEKGLVVALIRGDLEVSESKLKVALQVEEVRLADAETIQNECGTEQGYLGPVGIDKSIKLIADTSVKRLKNLVTGAGEVGYHYINTNVGRDFNPDFADIKVISEGDACPECGKPLKISRGIEVGHIFLLGEKYSSDMKASFLDEGGKDKPFYMGCYGIGVSRVVAAAIEQHHDGTKMVWPAELAPWQLQILPLNTKNDRVMTTAELIYESVKSYGSVMIDDRNLRAGVKFKDASLIGSPYHLIVGEKKLNEGLLEFLDVKTDERIEVSVEDVIGLIKEKLDRRRRAGSLSDLNDRHEKGEF